MKATRELDVGLPISSNECTKKIESLHGLEYFSTRIFLLVPNFLSNSRPSNGHLYISKRV